MFSIPTLKDLVERTRRSFRDHLPGSDAWLWPNNINPTAKVIAGALHEGFGFLDYVARQKFALTADAEHLDMHGEELGLSRRPAAPARGKVTLAADGALDVAPGALFRRADGIEYRALSSAVLVAAGAAEIDVIATADGKTTDAIEGTALDIVSGVTGEALAEVSEAIVGGADIEDGEAFRARILFRKRNPPHGGAPADYVMWAGEVSGVSVNPVTAMPDVFVERLWSGPGTVRVFPFMHGLYANGIPPAPEIARVRDHIELLRPAGAIVSVAAATAVPVDITIENLAPDTIAVREAVLAELRAAFRRLAVVAGSDTPHGGMPYLAVEASFSRSWIWQAIANATGEQRHVVTAPPDDIALTSGQIATLGAVTFS